MTELDRLFGDMAEACRKYLAAYAEAKPTPERTSDRNANKLADASNAVSKASADLDAYFSEDVK